MNRQLILLSVLILVGAVAGGYGYLQWSEKEKSARAAELARKQRQQAQEEQDKLVSEARAWLDAWGGKGELLLKATANLTRVLQANSRHVRARLELARAILNAGYVSSRNFQPGTLEKAEREIKRALSQAPDSADAHILLGRLYYLRYQSEEALKTFEKAEAIGTKNPWLHLNWAVALMDLGRWGEVEPQFGKAQAQLASMGDPPLNALITARSIMAGIYLHQRRLEDADKEYQALIALDPASAWAHGNYAWFLLFTRGMPDAAIAEAERSIEIMDYGMARITLAAARYAKWAEVKRRTPAQAAQYLALAKESASDFSWIMPQAAKSVSAGPVIQNMVTELMKLGVSIDTSDEYGDTGLNLAADLGDLEAILLLIKYGANPEIANRSGSTALTSAVVRRHTDVVKALVAHGANVNVRDQIGRSPLHAAAQKGDHEMVRTLISLKADVNIATTINGHTPLMYAAYQGDEKLARILLQAGADPSPALTDTQQTAADIAMSRGHHGLAALFRDAAQKHAATRR